MQTVYTRFENLKRLPDVYDLSTPIFYNNNFYIFVDNIWEPYFPKEKELFCEINTKKIYIYKNCILKLQYNNNKCKNKCKDTCCNCCDDKNFIQNIYINLQKQINELNSCSILNDEFFESLFFWKQIGQDIDGETSFDRSGYSVSINSDGNIVAIGAPYNDINSGLNTNNGRCIIYKFDGSNWNQLGQKIDGEAVNDFSAWSVSLNSTGDIVAIGAPFNDENGHESGHCRVYKFNGLFWIQLGTDINGKSIFDQLGWSVSLNSTGNIVAIGAVGSVDINSDYGRCRVYKFNGSDWIQLGLDIDGEALHDRSGYSVSLNSIGNIVAIGAPFNDENGINSGQCRVYKFDSSNWVKLGRDIDGEAFNDRLGWSVSLNSDGNIVAIGARFNDGNGNNSGHCRIYKFDGLVWNQFGQDIDGEAVFDSSGYSVSLNSCGNIVAIGARFNDGNGNNSGHCRIYKFNCYTNIWEKIGQDIDGEASDDESGQSVSINSNGNIVAIGALFNNGNVPLSAIGHCRIYKLSI